MGKIAGLCLALLVLTGCFEPPKKTALGFAIDGYPITKAMVNQVIKETQTEPAYISFFLQWPERPEQYTAIDSTLHAIDPSVPVLTWEPMYYIGQKRVTIPYQKILKGDYDSYIKAFARSIKAFDKPVIIRFGHEMNLGEYHWGTENYTAKNPEIYKQLFRYMVALFKKENVSNVKWAFCPNVDSVPAEPWNTAAAYYPGDDVVDIVGADGYDWDGNRSFADIIKPIYDQLKAITSSKPVIIFETATPRADKELWLHEALDASTAWGIEGLIWFQVDKEKKWKITSTR